MRRGKTAPLDPDGGWGASTCVRLRVPKRDTAVIDRLAEKNGTTRSAVIREAINALIRDRESELERESA